MECERHLVDLNEEEEEEKNNSSSSSNKRNSSPPIFLSTFPSSSSSSLSFSSSSTAICALALSSSTPPSLALSSPNLSTNSTFVARRRRRLLHNDSTSYRTNNNFSSSGILPFQRPIVQMPLLVLLLMLMTLPRVGQCQNVPTATATTTSIVPGTNGANFPAANFQQFGQIEEEWHHVEGKAAVTPEVVTPRTVGTTLPTTGGSNPWMNAVVVEQRRKLVRLPSAVRPSSGKRKRRRRIHSVSCSVNSQMANAPSSDRPATESESAASAALQATKDAAVHQAVPLHRHHHQLAYNEEAQRGQTHGGEGTNNSSSNINEQSSRQQQQWTRISRVDSAEPFNIGGGGTNWEEEDNNRVDNDLDDLVDGNGGKQQLDAGKRQNHATAIGHRRMVLTNEGLERAVILVPTSIEQQQPKVLTAIETFGGANHGAGGSSSSSLVFRERENILAQQQQQQPQPKAPPQPQPQYRRIAKRVEGEAGSGEKRHWHLKTIPTTQTTTTTSSSNNNTTNTIPTTKTIPNPLTSTITTTTMVPWLRFPARHWQLPPPLLMARLRRFNTNSSSNSSSKAVDLLLLKQMGLGENGPLLGIGTAEIREGGNDGRKVQEIAVGSGGPSEEEELAFMIDDANIHQQEQQVGGIDDEKVVPLSLAQTNGWQKQQQQQQLISLRTKFPKNRETLRPIQLAKVDESDMDLLFPSPPPPPLIGANGIGTRQPQPQLPHSSHQLKPIQRLSSQFNTNQQQQQLAPIYPSSKLATTFQQQQHPAASAAAFYQKPVPIPTVPSSASSPTAAFASPSLVPHASLPSPAAKVPPAQQKQQQTLLAFVPSPPAANNNNNNAISPPIRWPAPQQPPHTTNGTGSNGTSNKIGAGGGGGNWQQNAIAQQQQHSVPTVSGAAPFTNSSELVVNNNGTSSLMRNPNAKLELCCRRQNLPSTCQQFCNYDTFTTEKLLVALLGSQCPAKQLGKAFDCAHSKVDHSECCQRAGIHRIHNGQCMVFCRTHIPTPPNVLGYVSCLSSFGTIKNCYRDHQLKHTNLFGD